VVLDPGARRLEVGGEAVKLGGRAFDVLVALVQRLERVVPKQELLDLVWPGLVVEENTLQVHIAALRRVLGAQAVATVSGRGYRFTLSIETRPAPLIDAAQPQAEAALIGRDALLAELAALLSRDGVRLVTLVGAGGVGKTCVALQATAQAAMRLRDGATTVMLAAVRDPSQVMTAVATALGLREGGAVQAAELVRDFVRRRELLLTLDNLEHLPSPGEWLLPLLELAPRLKVLATSRVPTRLAAECVLRVPSLGLPADDSASALRAAPAVQLFNRRAAALGRPVFDRPDDLRAAGLICSRLDGLPLAIELAAARLRVLTPASLAERLQQALPLLTGGPADAPARHQTLRGAIAWSHDLLDVPTQRLFRRLAVFAGGWTLEAAEAVDDEPGGVIDRIEALLDHGLVQRVDDVAGQERYAMLETLREYAQERVAATGDADEARERHAVHFTQLAVAQAPHVASAARTASLARLRVELNNLRVALDWRVHRRRDAAAALPLVAALAWPWYFEGLYREGLAWMAQALALPSSATDAPAARAAVLSGAARLAAYSGDVGAALVHVEASVALWRRQSGRQGLAFARFHEGVACIMSMALDRARAALAEALVLFRELDDGWGIALATSYLGTSYAVAPGLEEQARPLLQEGRARFRALGDAWGSTVSSHYLGSIALRTGDLDTAAELTHEMLANSRELGDKYRIARNLHQLAEIDIAQGRVPQALCGLADSLALNAEQQRLGDAALQLRLLTRLARERGAPDVALRFAALAERHAGAAPTMPPDDPARHAAEVAALRKVLGPQGSLAPWLEGAALTFEAAAEAARAIAR
jgi:non-specific serine/threonine protein kinase